MTSTADATESRGALRGVRAVEFGQHIPGPLLGMLLAGQGADVIKVERLGGDPARSEPVFATWNRGKRSVELDLKTPDGLKQAHELVNWADVVDENNRKGSLARLGLGSGSFSFRKKLPPPEGEGRGGGESFAPASFGSRPGTPPP